MVERERAKHNVVSRAVIEGENVAGFEIDLGIIRAQSARNFQRRFLLVDCVHCHYRADFPGIVDHESRNVARTSGEIEHAQLRRWLDPTPQEMLDEGVTSEIAIELTDVSQVALQLWRNRLRTVH